MRYTWKNYHSPREIPPEHKTWEYRQELQREIFEKLILT